MKIFSIQSWDLKRKKYWYIRKKMDNSYVCTDQWDKAFLFTNEQEARFIMYKIANKYPNMKVEEVDKNFLTQKQRKSIYYKDRLKEIV